MKACSAPWYELNLSAPDDNASACCYYGGAREAFAGGMVDLSYYWNGPSMKALRRLQSDPNPPATNGCSNCFYFQNIPNATNSDYFDFNQPPPQDISPLQLANWQLAKLEHEERRVQVECAPMRLYANFGYTCNLACKMCHQVPRRKNIDRFIRSDAMYAWENDLRKMMEICVIGGEPFAMPEAIKFMRRFAVDDTMDHVRLSIFSNGTVHHKHLEVLKQKRKLGFCISLDSIEGGYEAIRVGGEWRTVERNILMIKEAMANGRSEWYLNTNGIVMKTGVPFLPEFARWHVRHGITTQFLDFINFRGTEDAYFTENILNQPHLLDEVIGWEDNFEEAIEIFEKGGQASAAASLKHFRDRAVEARSAGADAKDVARRTRLRNDWSSVLDVDNENLASILKYYSGDSSKPSAYDPNGSTPRFSITRPGDLACTPWIPVSIHAGSVYKLTVEWARKLNEGERRTHVAVQSQNGDIDGFREYRDTASSTILTMTGMLLPGAERLRVSVYPVGEDVSIFPQCITFDLDPLSKVKNIGSIVTTGARGKTASALIEAGEPSNGWRSVPLLAHIASQARAIRQRAESLVGTYLGRT